MACHIIVKRLPLVRVDEFARSAVSFSTYLRCMRYYFNRELTRVVGHAIFRYLQMISHRAMIFCFMLLCLSGWAFGESKVPVGAPITLLETELYWKDWPERRTTKNLLDLDVIRVLLSLFKEDVGQNVIIRYPGGDEGNAWAVEFKEWLVSFGLPSDYVSLQPGSGGVDRLLILVETLATDVSTNK